MFVEGGKGWPPPWQPPPRGPRLTPRQERIVVWLVVLNALLLVIAPIGGATVIQAVIALLVRA